MGVYVTNRVEGDSKKRKAAWSAAAYIGGKDISFGPQLSSGFQPYRNSHFNYDEWEAAGYDRAVVIIWDLILIHIIIQTHLTSHVCRVYFSTTQLLRTNWPKGLLANMVGKDG